MDMQPPTKSSERQPPPVPRESEQVQLLSLVKQSLNNSGAIDLFLRPRLTVACFDDFRNRGVPLASLNWIVQFTDVEPIADRIVQKSHGAGDFSGAIGGLFSQFNSYATSHFLAGSSDGQLFLFGYVKGQGTYCCCNVDPFDRVATLDNDTVAMSFSIRFATGTPFKWCTVVVDGKTMDQTGFGPWPTLWQKAVGKILPQCPSINHIAFVRLQRIVIRTGDPQASPATDHLLLLASSDSGVVAWPTSRLPAKEDFVAWYRDSASLQLIRQDDDSLVCDMLTVADKTDPQSLDDLTESLPKEIRTNQDPASLLKSAIAVSASGSGAEAYRTILLRKNDKCVEAWYPNLTLQGRYDLAWSYGDALSLQSEDGEHHLLASLPRRDHSGLVGHIPIPQASSTENGRLQAWMIRQEADRCAGVNVQVEAGTWKIGEEALIAQVSKITANDLPDGITQLTLHTLVNGNPGAQRLLAPSAVAYAAWQLWSVGRTQVTVHGSVH